MVEPLRVVDDADQRLLLGDVGEQRQRGQADQEPVGRSAGAEAEHRRERVALRGGKRLEVLEHRRAELVQAAVGQLHLRLDAGRRGDVPAGDAAGDVAQQGALARRPPRRARRGRRCDRRARRPGAGRALALGLPGREPHGHPSHARPTPPRAHLLTAARADPDVERALPLCVLPGDVARARAGEARPCATKTSSPMTTPTSITHPRLGDEGDVMACGVTGQTLLVIGGSSGIGFETARRAREEGAE